MKIAVYTDIHHDEYGNGLSLDDTVAIERQFTSVAMMADLAIFAGDRFRSRNPLDMVKTRADVEVLTRAKMKIPTYYLVGNHDRHTKFAQSTHSFEFIKQIRSEIPFAVVMDEMKKYTFTKNGKKVAIYAFPAGCAIESFKIDETDADYNIAVFHDLIIGSDIGDRVYAQHGFDASVLDLEAFDLVIGGDNHVRQNLRFKNTTAWYVGAAAQHNWGDKNKERGITIFDVSDTISMEFIPSVSPKFVEVVIKNDKELGALDKSKLAGNIVNVVFDFPVQFEHRRTEHVIDTVMRKYDTRKVNVEYNNVVQYSNPLSAPQKNMTDRSYFDLYVNTVYKTSDEEFTKRILEESARYLGVKLS